MEKAINLLKTVYATMDTIEVRGIDNQDKFVGCALSIQNAVRLLEDTVKKSEEVANGG